MDLAGRRAVASFFGQDTMRENQGLAEKVGFYLGHSNPKELAAFSFVPNKALARERPQAPRNALPAYTR